MKLKKWTRDNVLILLGLTVGVIVLYALHPGCIYKKLFGIECIGCGLSRGCYALLRFDFARAWHMNPISFCIPFWCVWGVCKGQPFESRRLNRIILWLLTGCTAVLVIIRVILMIIMYVIQ